MHTSIEVTRSSASQTGWKATVREDAKAEPGREQARVQVEGPDEPSTALERATELALAGLDDIEGGNEEPQVLANGLHALGYQLGGEGVPRIVISMLGIVHLATKLPWISDCGGTATAREQIRNGNAPGALVALGKACGWDEVNIRPGREAFGEDTRGAGRKPRRTSVWNGAEHELTTNRRKSDGTMHQVHRRNNHRGSPAARRIGGPVSVV